MSIVQSSFRDPSGFVFQKDGLIYRQINNSYRENYDHLMDCGLYKALVDRDLLVSHQEIEPNSPIAENAYKVIRPEQIPFISYPYEWCFSQLKDAALVTLEVQKSAVDFGMSLKDCSAYNIQFLRGKPVFIDTLSFEKYQEEKPWIAYRQFCQHFLAPLALMSHKDIRLSQLLRVHIDGVPLDLASSLLPLRTRLIFPILIHIHLHALSQKHFEDRKLDMKGKGMSKHSFLGLIESLESAVKGLKWQPQGTEWADYYEDTNYSADALKHKREIVAEFLEEINPKTVWDLGANDGMFSRIASDKGILTVSFDIDPAAVEKNYKQVNMKREMNILPLLLDLINPSPAIGWDNQERMSLHERHAENTVFALALIHHLAISNNLPFEKIVSLLSEICSTLIIEFVPKEDSQVKRLLSTREDIFDNYTKKAFETAFEHEFNIIHSKPIKDTIRNLYLMRRI
jgi:ribosomal protein L11 methylase PrmA